ncbi:hypothetical protein B5S28_g3123 [[Candida] boidinii]|nr:hypothetical protein B5S28_g3123 [[Candida] boidinii]OWB61598.1 hypothetical protein B5S29_g2494 [[Candida] boidinii]
MKFGEDLNEHLVPEWRDQYFNYKKGKKELKKLKNKKSAILHLSSLTNTPISKLKPQLLTNSNNLSNKINDEDFELNLNQNHINNNNNPKDSLQSFALPSPAIEPEDILQKNSNSNSNSHSHSSVIPTKSSHLKGTGITNFTETEIDPTDTTSNDANDNDDNINEGTPLLTPNDSYIIPKQNSKPRSSSLRPTHFPSDFKSQDDSAINFGSSNNNNNNNNNNSSSDPPYTNSPFAIYLNRRKSTFTKYLSRSNSISYSSSISPNQLYNTNNNKTNNNNNNNNIRKGSNTSDYNNNTELENLSDYARDQFIEWVDSELRKIESFYKDRENSYLERFLILQDQVVRLKDQKLRSKLKAARMKRKLKETSKDSPESVPQQQQQQTQQKQTQQQDQQQQGQGSPSTISSNATGVSQNITPEQAEAMSVAEAAGFDVVVDQLDDDDDYDDFDDDDYDDYHLAKSLKLSRKRTKKNKIPEMSTLSDYISYFIFSLRRSTRIINKFDMPSLPSFAWVHSKAEKQYYEEGYYSDDHSDSEGHDHDHDHDDHHYTKKTGTDHTATPSNSMNNSPVLENNQNTNVNSNNSNNMNMTNSVDTTNSVNTTTTTTHHHHKRNSGEHYDPKFNRRDYSRKLKKEEPPVHIPFFLARRQLKTAFYEFYRSLELLKSYRLLNRTAFRKMIKKYDKATKDHLLPTYMKKIDESYFTTSDILENLMTQVEETFTDVFENGNRKIAITKLRSADIEETFYFETFLIGLFMGFGVPLMVLAIVNAFYKMDILDNLPEGKLLLQIWAGYFLIVLMALLLGVNCMVWSKFKVNYKFIFEFNQRDALDYKQYMVLPAFFLFIGSLLSWFSFENIWPERFNGRDWPWIFLAIAVFILFNPFDVFHLNSRIWMLSSLWRLLLSGFYPVEFKDFFLGDVFCSLTYSMGNISMFFCLYSTHWKGCLDGTNSTVCASSKSRLMGFLATLPSIWRLLQCFRRYGDTGDWFPHLANLVKYGVSTLYYMSLSLYRIDTIIKYRALLITFGTLNSVLSAAWDILMDWSLLQFDSENFLLRDELSFKNPWYYYIAIILDIILRFQWIFYALFSTQIQQSAVTSFCIAVAEILRRFIWLFFRMENEHATNVHLFRASRETPLPYPIVRFNKKRSPRQYPTNKELPTNHPISDQERQYQQQQHDEILRRIASGNTTRSAGHVLSTIMSANSEASGNENIASIHQQQGQYAPSYNNNNDNISDNDSLSEENAVEVTAYEPFSNLSSTDEIHNRYHASAQASLHSKRSVGQFSTDLANSVADRLERTRTRDSRFTTITGGTNIDNLSFNRSGGNINGENSIFSYDSMLEDGGIQAFNPDLEYHGGAKQETKRRGSVYPILERVSKVLTNAHIKDFQRRKVDKKQEIKDAKYEMQMNRRRGDDTESDYEDDTDTEEDIADDIANSRKK